MEYQFSSPRSMGIHKSTIPATLGYLGAPYLGFSTTEAWSFIEQQQHQSQSQSSLIQLPMPLLLLLFGMKTKFDTV